MNFNWNPDTIRWYQDANFYTGYYKRVAELIATKLEGYSTFCDIGCGLGLVDLELSKYIESITCIDINSEAIYALKKSMELRKITNIETRLMDCEYIEKNWDVIFISFFGSRNIERFLPNCKKLIAVVGKDNNDELFPRKCGSFKKNTYDKVEKELIDKGIPYCIDKVLLEFGQPFISMEDAEKFVRTYSPGISQENLEFFLTKRIVKTGEKEYPYIIPRKKPIGIFEIQGYLNE